MATSSSAERAALEAGDMEDLIPPSQSRGPSAASSSSSPSDVLSAVGYRVCALFSYVYAYINYSYVHYRTEFYLGCVLVFCSLLAVSGVLAPRHGRRSYRRGYHNPAIAHDWSQVQSALDLKQGSIDHWCLRGGDDQCRCEDPLVPSPRSETKMWGAAHASNKRAIASAIARQDTASASAASQEQGGYGANDDGPAWFEEGYQDDWNYNGEEGYEKYYEEMQAAQQSAGGAGGAEIDVVFLGDSIVEHRAGKFFGKDNEKFKGSRKVFEKSYSRANGAKYEGLALGIAGDTAPNLLWRILHGEMPISLNPRIWWINIGTNDIGATQCSEEVTLLGILRVVEEILNKKPDAEVVVNSILPMTRDKSGFLEDGRSHKGRNGKSEFWPSIKAVNKQLERFADQHKKVKFFDATPIFTEKQGSKLVVDMTLIEDGVHPTPAGYKAWDKEIVKRIETIESKEDAKKAEAKAEADSAAAAAAAGAAAGDGGEGGYSDWADDMYFDDMYYAAQYSDDAWIYVGQGDGQ